MLGSWVYRVRPHIPRLSIPAAYLTVILIWSTTPLAINKWSAQGGGFSFAVASRMAIGLVVAGLIIAIWRVGLPLHRRARMSYLWVA